jgi:hypothetical protein
VKKLLALGCKLTQDGDSEMTMRLPEALLEAVLEVIKPRKRRVFES